MVQAPPDVLSLVCSEFSFEFAVQQQISSSLHQILVLSTKRNIKNFWKKTSGVFVLH